MYWQAYRCKVFWAIVLGQNVLLLSFFALAGFFFPANAIVQAIAENKDGFSLLLLGVINLSSLPMSVLLAKRVEKYTEVVFKGELLDQIRHDTRNSLWSISKIVDKYRQELSGDYSKAKANLNKIELILSDPQKIKKLWKAKKDVSFIDLVVDQAVNNARLAAHKIAPHKIVSIELGANNQTQLGAFTLIPSGTLERAIENTLNNAIEAIAESNCKEGLIALGLKQSGPFFELTIKDNGQGLEKNKVHKVFDRGFSQGKKNKDRSGMGIGLTWAKENLIENGGDIQFESEYGKGSVVTIKIPKAQGPYWFCHNLDTSRINNVVVADDSDAVFSRWAARFEGNSIGLKYAKNQDEFSNLLENTDLDSSLFLIDFDFNDKNYDGIDLIKKIRSKSDVTQIVLVTDKLHNSKVYDSCKKHGVFILPKPMIDVVPILSESESYQVYLLDDDETASGYAKEELQELELDKFVSFSSSEDDLRSKLENAPKNVEILLDDRLGVGKKRGAQIGKELLQEGFENISLITGATSDELEEIPTEGFKEVISKSDFDLSQTLTNKINSTLEVNNLH